MLFHSAACILVLFIYFCLFVAIFQPLRNKKADVDSDENTPGEYVLTKPKNDSAKPSKHQEKKQKQLAKKEKVI